VLTFSGMFIDDMLADFLKLMTYFAVLMMLVYSRQYLADRGLDKGEFYLLVIYATMGMMIMISAASFLTMYLGLELMSLSLYGLVAIDRDSVRGTEAAMKYFVLGALASGLLLYGMSMVYGATGSLELGGIAQALYHAQAEKTVLVFGLVFIVAGIAFKLGLVPSTCGSRTSITARRPRSPCSSAPRPSSPLSPWRCDCWCMDCLASPPTGRRCCW
jgi:NADH-quinone oxidoreductase subunit N